MTTPATAAPEDTTKPPAGPDGSTERELSPDIDRERKGRFEVALVVVFVTVPFLALLAAVPVAWGWGLGWHDVVIAAVMYLVSGLGVTVGFHRHLTHGAFKAKRPLRAALAVAGSLAIEMPVNDWVAEHRRHHAFSDKEGDPHSPWRFGDNAKALTKGFLYAHVGWLFGVERASKERYTPDLLADPATRRISAAFPGLVAATLLLPPLVGGLWSMSWQGAATAFFWASLVRIALLHHVTWSVNSICHIWGEEDFQTRDRSRNVWWLAILSFGESWHNLHHADPTCARHGVLPGQIDISARVIQLFERLGWAYKVRWPSEERLAKRRLA